MDMDMPKMNLVDKTLNDNKPMIEQILKELKETWGYETEELYDFREKLEEVAHAAFWEGYHERSAEVDRYVEGFAYGRKEDQ